MSKEISVSFPFLQILTLMFIGLKLTNYITWSWWWVLAPLWMPIVIGLGLFAVYLIIFIGVSMLAKK